MIAHVTDERLLDALEGTGTADRAHLDACPECQARLAEARAGLALARGASIPEPSPLYWESLRRQIRRAVEQEERRRPAGRVSLGPALAAAAVLAAIVTFLSVGDRRSMPAAEPTLPAWSALPAAEDDPGLDVLRAVTPAVADATPPATCSAVDECVVDLSDEESQALAESLRREIRGGRDL